MIQSVERAFHLLYEIAKCGKGVTISQLAGDVELPGTTVVRLLVLHQVSINSATGLYSSILVWGGKFGRKSGYPSIPQLRAVCRANYQFGRKPSHTIQKHLEHRHSLEAQRIRNRLCQHRCSTHHRRTDLPYSQHHIRNPKKSWSSLFARLRNKSHKDCSDRQFFISPATS